MKEATLEELAKAELTARVQRARGFAENREQNLASAVNRASALMTIAAEWGSLGRCQLQLGHKEEARLAFTKTARWLRERVRTPHPAIPDAPDLKSMLELSIICGDRDSEGFASSADPSDESKSLTPLTAAYFRAIKAFSRRDEVLARKSGDELLRIPDVVADKVKYYPGLGAAVDALFKKESSAFDRALNTILERHARNATRGHLQGLETAFICLPATCLAILAKRRGIPISVDSQSTRFNMTCRVTGLEQWQGKPTKGLVFQLEVNCLPMDLY